MKQIILVCLLMVTASANAANLLPQEQGLTIAHIKADEKIQLVAVIEDSGQNIQGINLTEVSGIEGNIAVLFASLGYNGLEKLIAAHQNQPLTTYAYSTLLSPAGEADHHIALGLNYTEHADEVESSIQPFLFLKTTQATREQAIQYDNRVLLDYEIEVCARRIQGNDLNGQPVSSTYGFFLCGDFTDRAYLLRNIDLDDMRSGKGFSGAKSIAGYFPTGPYMVIPKQREQFLAQLNIKLYVNENLKQNAWANEMIWSLDTIEKELYAAQMNSKATFSQRTNWLDNGTLSSDMTLLTGTPSGVIFRPPDIGFKVWQGIKYVMSGAFLKMPALDYILDAYAKSLLEEQVFLMAGDTVKMQGSYLGNIRIDIE